MTQSESIHRGSAFVWLAASTAVLLLLPLIAMQVSDQVSWGLLDFGVMAILIFGAGSSFIILARGLADSHRLILALLTAIAFLYLWAEVAVGIFFKFGS